MADDNKFQLPDEETFHKEFLEELSRVLGIKVSVPERLVESQDNLPDLRRWVEYE